MKALFNIKKLQFAKLNDNNGTITYETPMAIPGTVSLSMEVAQEQQKFYADGVTYIVSNGAESTTGTLENYFIPKNVLMAIYRYIESTNDELLQTDDQPFEFGMQFACDDENGDEVYFSYYRCSSTKPGVNLQTKEDGITINPQSVGITAIPVAVGDKKVTSSFADKNAGNYSTYFTAMTIPTPKASL